MTTGRALRREEVPEAVWEFRLWVVHYARERQVTELTPTQYAEVAAEAVRRGLIIDETLNVGDLKH
jgi:hypothetical protein